MLLFLFIIYFVQCFVFAVHWPIQTEQISSATTYLDHSLVLPASATQYIIGKKIIQKGNTKQSSILTKLLEPKENDVPVDEMEKGLNHQHKRTENDRSRQEAKSQSNDEAKAQRNKYDIKYRKNINQNPSKYQEKKEKQRAYDQRRKFDPKRIASLRKASLKKQAKKKERKESLTRKK